MTIELAITDETPQPVPGLSDDEILDCFLGAELNGSYRQYLLKAGREILAKAEPGLLRTVLEETQLEVKGGDLWLTLGSASMNITERGPIVREQVARWFTRKQQALHGQEPTA